MRKQELKLKRIHPQIGVEGGLVAIECSGFGSGRNGTQGQVRFSDLDGQIVSASEDRIIVRIPSGAQGGNVTLVVNGKSAAASKFQLLEKFVSELHPVANPAVDREGNVYSTFSGTRGESVPFSLYKITDDGEKQPLPVDIVNPTGLALDPEEQLYVSSRYNGIIYRIQGDNQAEEFVSDLGIATGIVFDLQGNLYVGDRNGTIYKITPDREITEFARLEPSVSAYHLAFSKEGLLYVAGPTLTTQDSIYEVNSEGEARTFFSGLGRPQGLAFDVDGNLLVGASYKGNKGVFAIDRQGHITHFISSPVPVGLAFDGRGNLILALGDSLYKGFVGLQGTH